MIAALSLHIPSTAADTTDEWYLACPFLGSWRIIGVKFAPATAVTANDTNYVQVVIATNASSASTTWTDIATFTTQITGGIGFVLGTVISPVLSGLGLEFGEGRQIRISKTDPGSGQILDGTFTFALQKMN